MSWPRYDRYKRVGLQRSTFDNVDHWDAPDAETFVIHLKQVQPTFIEQLSSFAVPIVIIPAEDKDDPPQQLKTIGTGPWQMVEYVPGGYVKLKRFADYTPNTNYDDRTGFGGYKQACFDTVAFRIVTEPGARVSGLQTGELQGAEDVPAKALNTLKHDKNITLIPIQNWSILIAYANLSQPPTDNLMFRKAVQAALNMDEVMDAATDGNYRLNVGFQYPNQSTYTDAGKATYNIHDPARAKQYLQQAGYKGEPITLLTNKDYTYMYNASVVMAEQLKDAGINAQLKVVDWPTAVAMRQKADFGLELFLHRLGHRTFAGADPDHAGAGAAESGLFAEARAVRPRPGRRLQGHEHAADGGRPAGRVRAHAETNARSGLCGAIRLDHHGGSGAIQRERFQTVPHPAGVQRVVWRLIHCPPRGDFTPPGA